MSYMKITEEDYKRAVFSVSLKIYNNEIPAIQDIDVLVHAANKQIAKPISIVPNSFKEKCPCCNNEVNYRYIYCFKCGQKLDWEYKNR